VNMVLLRYDIPVPDIAEPFEFFLPEFGGDGAAHFALNDQNLTIHLVTSSTSRTHRYRGQLYGVGEPFVRSEGGWASLIVEASDGLPRPLVLIATPLDPPDDSKDRVATKVIGEVLGVSATLSLLSALGLLSQPNPNLDKK